jgi:dTDP-4-dehydrorhamnose 3,5-epimerase-like enzyme
MKYCRRVDLPEIVDPRGRLMFAEHNLHIPFEFKRIFAIYDLPAGVRRGGHAHREQHQFIVMLNGASRVSINEGPGIVDVRLDRPNQGLYVPPMVWIELGDFTPAAVCLVLASAHFDEADYIRDHVEFRNLVVDK